VLKAISKSIHTAAALTGYKLPIIYIMIIKDNIRKQPSVYNNYYYVTFYTPQLNNCNNIPIAGGATA